MNDIISVSYMVIYGDRVNDVVRVTGPLDETNIKAQVRNNIQQILDTWKDDGSKLAIAEPTFIDFDNDHIGRHSRLLVRDDPDWWYSDAMSRLLMPASGSRRVSQRYRIVAAPTSLDAPSSLDGELVANVRAQLLRDSFDNPAWYGESNFVIWSPLDTRA